MKLTVDCVLTAAFLNVQNPSALAKLLNKAKVNVIEKPLEAIICEQSGLQASPDYPIAAIAAAADGLDVNAAYWLRADPVHLVLQRDCFSLDDSTPLQVTREHSEQMIATLNAHFTQDGLLFLMGKSGAWYLRLAQTPQIKTSLPSVAMGKNVRLFMPQGVESSQWLAVLNEAQMLLFEHPVNLTREALGELAVNSIWLSGGGAMPPMTALQNNVDLIVANHVFYQGLAKWGNVPYLAQPNHLDAILKSTATHVRLQLAENHLVDNKWLAPLFTALKNNQIKQLTLNLGFYEKSLIVEIKPLDLYKFWRGFSWKVQKSVMDYL